MIYRAAAAILLASVSATPIWAQVSKPAALTASGIPAVPQALADKSRPYLEYRTAGFSGWDSSDRSMLISTRFGNTSQLHRVAMPMGARQQLTFEEEPVGASIDPTGSVIVVSMDIGGSEFDQLYRWDDGKLVLLTDGKSRNGLNAMRDDGKAIAFSSTKRTGKFNDLYVMDPANPKTAKLVHTANSGGWFFADWLPGYRKAVIGEYVSVTNSDLHVLDLATGKATPVPGNGDEVAISGVEIGKDGRVWVVSDRDSDFSRLGLMDLETGKFTPVGDFGNWDVTSIDLSKDGRTMAVVTNEKGSSRLFLYDVASGATREVTALGPGLIGGVEFAPWGELGFTFTSADSPADAYSIDPASLAIKRWTKSETGGLDPERNVEPVLVEVDSFDDEKVSGFLYRPDPKKFPGKRPLLVNIHGGPEGQSRPGFMGATNYYLNELGIGVFFPNVRGSTGYGKRFVALDNGPDKREDSVKDIGAFLDTLQKDPAIDADRIGVTGGSYGGYMCYASIIRYADRLKGALCNVAISNFVTFLENTQDYRRDLRRVEYGDERDPAQRAKLMAISPLTRIKEIKDPLFVIQGANDPRVPKSEADQLVAQVRANGQDVWYLVGENEGHGFAKKENRDYQFWTSLMFWEKTLLK